MSGRSVYLLALRSHASFNNEHIIYLYIRSSTKETFPLQSLANLVTPSPLPSPLIFLASNILITGYIIIHWLTLKIKFPILRKEYSSPKNEIKTQRLYPCTCIMYMCVCVYYVCMDVTNMWKTAFPHIPYIYVHMYTHICMYTNCVYILCTCHRFQSYLFRSKIRGEDTYDAQTRAYARTHATYICTHNSCTFFFFYFSFLCWNPYMYIYIYTTYLVKFIFSFLLLFTCSLNLYSSFIFFFFSFPFLFFTDIYIYIYYVSN